MKEGKRGLRAAQREAYFTSRAFAWFFYAL